MNYIFTQAMLLQTQIHKQIRILLLFIELFLSLFLLFHRLTFSVVGFILFLNKYQENIIHLLSRFNWYLNNSRNIEEYILLKKQIHYYHKFSKIYWSSSIKTLQI